MSNRISLMLDNMFNAVEEGFSYDGIVSAPGTGLEDRPRLTVLLHDAVDLVRIARDRAGRILRIPPHDDAGLTLAPPEMVVQASARPAEDRPQIPDINRDAQPSILAPETDDQNHPTCQATGVQQVVQDDEEAVDIQSHEAPLYMDGRNLSASQEMVTQRSQPVTSISEHSGEGVGVRSIVASSHATNSPVRPVTETPPPQSVIRPVEYHDEELGIQSRADLSDEQEHDLPGRVRFSGVNETEIQNYADPYPHLKQNRTRMVALVATCTIAMVVNASNLSLILIALPEIGRALDVRQDELQWLLSAYSLGIGCLLLFFQSVVELYGCKRLFLLGMVWQVCFALGCGFSNSGTVLNVLRGLQGAGAAIIIPTTLGIAAGSPSVYARSAVFATFTGTPVGTAFGTIIGGVLTELTTQHWRSPFFLSAALSFTCLIGGWISIDKDKSLPKADRTADWIGVVLVTCGLTLIMFALGQGQTSSWKTSYVIVSLIAGVALVAIFLLWEHRLEKMLDRHEERESIWTSPPMMKFSLWTRARGQVTVVLAIIFLNWCGFTCWTFWVQLYYQYYLQLSPLRTVVRLIPMFVVDLVGFFLNPILVARVPFVVLVVSGALSTGIACVLFALIDPSITYWAFSFPSTLLVMTGANIVHLASASFIVKVREPGDENLLLTMTRIGAAFGLAVSTIAFNSVNVNAAEYNLPESAELHGYRAAQFTGAGFSFFAALLAAVFLRGVGTAGHESYFQTWSLISHGEVMQDTSQFKASSISTT